MIHILRGAAFLSFLSQKRPLKVIDMFANADGERLFEARPFDVPPCYMILGENVAKRFCPLFLAFNCR